MNLNDYPTPRTDQFRTEDNGDTSWLLDECSHLEREAAAWRAVAECLAKEFRETAWLCGFNKPNTAEQAIADFDALKAELEKP